MFTVIAIFRDTLVDKHRDKFSSNNISLLVVEDASDLRKLVENLARNVIFVGCWSSAGADRALKNALQNQSYTSMLAFYAIRNAGPSLPGSWGLIGTPGRGFHVGSSQGSTAGNFQHCSCSGCSHCRASPRTACGAR